MVRSVSNPAIAEPSDQVLGRHECIVSKADIATLMPPFLSGQMVAMESR